MAFIMEYVCEALAALAWLGSPTPPLALREMASLLSQGMHAQHPARGEMPQRPTSPPPEGNLIDNPRKKLNPPTYFILQEVFPHLLLTSKII